MVGEARLEVPRNAPLGLMAPNGAGKTTLLRLLSGAPSPRGRATICMRRGDALISPLDQKRYRENLCYLPSDGRFALGHLRAGEAVELAMLLWKNYPRGCDVRSRARAIASDMGIEPFRSKKVRLLSSGMRQQLCIAMALATLAPVLLLDEPMNALDSCVVRSDVGMLRQWASRKECRAIFLSSHLLPTLDALCSEVCCLAGGKILRLSLADVGKSASEAYWETYPPQR